MWISENLSFIIKQILILLNKYRPNVFLFFFAFVSNIKMPLNNSLIHFVFITYLKNIMNADLKSKI